MYLFIYLFIYLQNTPLTQGQLETYIRLSSEDVSSNLIQSTSKDNMDLIEPTSENMNLVQKEPQTLEQELPIVTITVRNLFLIW